MTIEEKSFDKNALDRSVRVSDQINGYSGLSTPAESIFFMAQTADDFEPWGSNVKLRDKQLRSFIPAEPIFLSSLGVVTSSNASFSWTIKGPPNLAEKYQRMLATSEFGRGWQHLITKVSVDLYTQDSGAFIEIIRESDSETAAVVGLAHLDAARCYHTGHPEVPVIYQDSHNRYHQLKWYQVATLSDLPTAIEGSPGLQYCALSRLLRAAQILRDISIYTKEKIGGRNTRAVTLVRGVTTKAIQDALEAHSMRSDSMGLMRFSLPLIVGAQDPKADIGFETLEIAGLPDGFDFELTMKHYISQIALAFKRDYQDFAPLPGGNLGTSAQSQILSEKARGKGPGEFRKIISQIINWLVLPDDVEFEWDEQDESAETVAASNKSMRATARKTRIDSGEITPEIARMIARDEGDLSQEQYDLLNKSVDGGREPRISGDTQPQDEDVQLNESESGQTKLLKNKFNELNWNNKTVVSGPRLFIENNLADAISDAFDASLKRLSQITGIKLKFNESEWTRNEGRFADYIGSGGGGGSSGGGEGSGL